MKQFKFPANQRFRVIVGVACFYATAKTIRAGVGDFTMCNHAVLQAMEALERTRSDGSVTGSCAIGLSGTWGSYQVQINLADKQK